MAHPVCGASAGVGGHTASEAVSGWARVWVSAVLGRPVVFARRASNEVVEPGECVQSQASCARAARANRSTLQCTLHSEGEDAGADEEGDDGAGLPWELNGVSTRLEYS